MGIFNFLRWFRAERPPDTVLELSDGVYAFETDDGEQIRGAGLVVRNAATGHEYRGNDDESERIAPGTWITRVAGVSRHRRTLARDAFAPGCPITLRAEPSNPHDPNAVSVWDGRGKHTIGYLPRELAAEAQRHVLRGELGALVVWEWLDDEGRCGVRLLIAPQDALPRRR